MRERLLQKPESGRAIRREARHMCADEHVPVLLPIKVLAKSRSLNPLRLLRVTTSSPKEPWQPALHTAKSAIH